MKKTILTLATIILLASCQSEEGRKASLYAKMSKDRLEIVRQTDDSLTIRAKMIDKYGEKLVNELDSVELANEKQYQLEKKLEQDRIDSIKNTLK